MPISRSGFLLSMVSGAALSMGAPLPLLAFTGNRRGQQRRVDDLHYSTFAGHVDTEFRIHRNDDRPVIATLAECKQWDTGYSVNGECFSIMFRCNGSEPLSQDIYKIDHPGIGTFNICIVPVGSDAKGAYFQAVFNR